MTKKFNKKYYMFRDGGKRCRHCNSRLIYKRVYDYYNTKKSGIKNRCIRCHSIRLAVKYDPTYQRNYFLKNKDKILSYQRDYYKDKYKERNGAYAKRIKQRSLRKDWSSRKQIREFYKNCPDGYEVDHIVPLNGKHVSGLHVIENLQYLPTSENRKKAAKFDVYNDDK